jgi:uncharacterized damage-inducible protein DinB
VKLTEFFASQLEREAPLTRKALERVPEGRPDWKPHEKSMPLGYLSQLVATMPDWIAMMVLQNELDLKPAAGPAYKPPSTDTRAKLLQAHDDAVAKGLDALRRTTDQHLATTWKLLVSGRVVMEQPRHVVIADTFTHLAHHRGQLTVYLRLNGAPVPSIYGPSADEGKF